ncbi:MAG: aminoacyl-tRNA hydrolase [Bacteroidales bacterium]|nr:aminoacyl-tRNA hydrolase [Bacteroidales bacterium]
MKFLIAGLGNVGIKYADTRHNIGFSVLDAWASQEKLIFESARYADLAMHKIRGRQVFLIKPTTYMNLCGKAVKFHVEKENIPLENILVIVDDIALSLGTIRIRPKGGDGGHNGLTDIISSLGTDNFTRLRFGIGNDFAKGFQADYVLSRWTKDEEAVINPSILKATEAIKHFVVHGLQNTMNTFNKK